LNIIANAHISPITNEALRSRGHDVTEVRAREKDSEILNLAKRTGAIVITQDLDYSHLLAGSRDTAPSVISLRLRILHPSYVANILVTVLDQYRDTIEKGAILSVNDTGEPRIRLLPVLD